MSRQLKLLQCNRYENVQILRSYSDSVGQSQEGGGVSRQIRGLVITTSVTSRHRSVIFDMVAKFFGSLTIRNMEISNFLMIVQCYAVLKIYERLLCSNFW